MIAINGEDPSTDQVFIDELNDHQTPLGKSNIKISLFRSKRYQRIDLEDIRYKFDQFRPVVSHLEVRLSKKLPTPKNIGGGLSIPQRKFWKEALFPILK